MLESLQQLHPVLQATLATLFTWGVTALGASVVLVTRTVNRRLLDSMNSLAPESQSGGNTDLATVSTILGLTVMMILDVALG